MKTIKGVLVLGILGLLMGSCKKDLTPKANEKVYGFTEIIDTKTRDINFQEKKIYKTSDSVFASNMFDGARLNNFYALNDSTYAVESFPENEPINPSPWYAFKIWSKTQKKIYLVFEYGGSQHRYLPKLSKDGQTWTSADSSNLGKFKNNEMLTLKISSDTTWVSAQELFTEQELNNWLKELSLKNQMVSIGNAGKSKLNRDLKYFEIGEKSKKNKDLIVLFSRQHPPEVTGQFALTAFVNGILKTSKIQKDFFSKYNVLVFPMLNPDGVALGHWRHNVGGIDLNRDWAEYNQPETKAVSDFVKKYAEANKNRVVLGLDFHSTYNDVYYTNLSDSISVLPNFTSAWLKSIKDGLPGYTPKISPSKIGQPVSKGWFFVNFNAVGITYEIGDDTPRDFIEEKGELSALKMMEILLQK
jgi:cytosolic carboxypeptidase protein 6